MSDLTPQDYQRSIAMLPAQKAEAELAAQQARDVHEGEVVEPDSGTRDA